MGGPKDCYPEGIEPVTGETNSLARMKLVETRTGKLQIEAKVTTCNEKVHTEIAELWYLFEPAGEVCRSHLNVHRGFPDVVQEIG